MTRKKLISTLIAVAVSIVFLYIAFRRIDVARLKESFATINWLWALPFLLLTWLALVWRAWRWVKLLRGTHQLKLRHTLGPIMIGFGFNSIFPARAGEFARPLALNKTAGVPYSTGLSSVIVERVWDMLALLSMFIVVSLMIEFDESFSYQYGDLTITAGFIKGIIHKITILAVIAIAGALLMLSGRFQSLMRRLLQWLPLLPAKPKGHLLSIFDSFVAGFSGLKSPLIVAGVAFDSLGIWFLTGFTFWIMKFGFPGLEISLLDAMVFLVVTCILVSLPSVPGFWGLYEVGGLIALKLTNPSIDESMALSYTLVVHFLQWALVTVIGLYYAARIHVSVKDVSTTKAELKT